MDSASWIEVETRLKGLLTDAVQGCDGSYHQFLLGLTPLLRRYFARRLHQRMADVEDLTQEVLLAVHRQRHTLDTSQPVTAWVHAVARYKLIDFYRSTSRSPEWVEWDEEQLSTLEVAEGPGEDAELMRALLDALPGGQRDAIRLVKLEGWSVRDASRMTGQSEASVKVNIHRGIKRLIAQFRGSAA